MKRLIPIMLFLISLSSYGQVSRAQYITDVNANIFTNSTHQITGLVLNTILKEQANSYWNTITDGTPLISTTGWTLVGNTGTSNTLNFLGTIDNKPLNFRVNNVKAGRIDNVLLSTFFGYEAGLSNTTGANNSAFGTDALQYNTIGNGNTAAGVYSLTANTTGINNTAIGFNALQNQTTQSSNVGIGAFAGFTVFGKRNVFIGDSAGYEWTGSNRGFIGNPTSDSLVTLDFNTAIRRVNINGTIKITSGAGAGKLLQSDANGFASWQTISTGLTVGTTAIASGTDTRLLYQKATGVLGESGNLTYDETTFKVIGTGATSATYTQKWANSSAQDLASIRDDGFMTLGSATGSSTNSQLEIYGGLPSLTFNYLNNNSYKWQIGGGTSPNALTVSNLAGITHLFGQDYISIQSNSGYPYLRFDGIGSDWVIQTTSTGIEYYSYALNNVVFKISNGADVSIGNPAPTAGARLHVKGSGATSATYSLKVENSSSTNLFSIQDDGTLTGFITSGTYTATITDSANVSAHTAYQWQYMRVGNVVTVSGQIDIDPTSTLTSTVEMVSLPIASNFTANTNSSGAAIFPGIAGQSAAVLGTTSYTTDKALIKWSAVDVTNQPCYVHFTYLIQ